MNLDQWTAVDRYLADLFVPHDAQLDAVLAESAAAGLPAIQVSPNLGKSLMLLARAHQARTILEIGTLGGYSAIWLARALPPGGRLITLESDSRFAEVARANFARCNLQHTIDVLIGNALETLPRLAEEGRQPFDFVFIDADKSNYAEYFDWALRLTRPGSLIVADNVVRKGAVLDADSDDPSVVGVRRFNQKVAAEPRVTATAIQTVGVKGHDGLLIALVK
jgi:predicted O-methyltransferase YrrM